MTLADVLAHVPAPPRSLVRAVTIATVVAQGGIAVTGSVVRVTGSGLGCPTWPQCFPGSFTPEPHPEIAGLTQWIEYGNRLLTGVVGIAALACVVLALLVRPARRRLVLLALTMPAGVLVQAFLGGILVRTGLVWWQVGLHFLVSMVLVWLAVLLVQAFEEGDAPPRWYVPTALRGLLVLATAVLAGLLVAGVLVTAAGPHAGDAGAPRLDVDIPVLAQVHADLLFGYLGLLAGLGFALAAIAQSARTVPRSTWRRYWALVVVVLAQGTIGAVQYATGVPEVLVSLHVLGAVTVVVAMAALWAGCRARDPEPQPAASAARTAEPKRANAAASA